MTFWTKRIIVRAPSERRDVTEYATRERAEYVAKQNGGAVVVEELRRLEDGAWAWIDASVPVEAPCEVERPITPPEPAAPVLVHPERPRALSAPRPDLEPSPVHFRRCKTGDLFDPQLTLF